MFKLIRNNNDHRHSKDNNNNEIVCFPNVGCFTVRSFEKCSLHATDRDADQCRNRANALWRTQWNMKIDCICVNYVWVQSRTRQRQRERRQHTHMYTKQSHWIWHDLYLFALLYIVLLSAARQFKPRQHRLRLKRLIGAIVWIFHVTKYSWSICILHCRNDLFQYLLNFKAFVVNALVGFDTVCIKCSHRSKGIKFTKLM